MAMHAHIGINYIQVNKSQKKRKYTSSANGVSKSATVEYPPWSMFQKLFPRNVDSSNNKYLWSMFLNNYQPNLFNFL